MDRGIWITWYDLPEQGRDTYLLWLHDTYIPGVLKRPGFLWAAHYASVAQGTVKTIPGALKREGSRPDAAVPTGDRYILLFGAEHAGAFGNPVPSALNTSLPDVDKKMLAMRIGERVNIMVEAERVDGPEEKTYKDGMALAPCIQLGSYNCPIEHEEDALGWYTQSRMPAMAKLNGVIRTRRLASVVGWAKHAVLYEWASLEARNKYFPTHEDGYPAEMKAWTARVRDVLIHAPGSANLAYRIWPAVLN